MCAVKIFSKSCFCVIRGRNHLINEFMTLLQCNPKVTLHSDRSGNKKLFLEVGRLVYLVRLI